MPFLTGVLTGVVLTILVAFVIDNIGDKPGSQDLVNWDYVGLKVGETAEKVGEEVREDVHKATEPEPEDEATPPPATTDTP